MFIAMNRFKIVPDLENDFEAVWKSRETYLDNVKDLLHLSFLKVPEKKNILFTLLILHGNQEKILKIGQSLKIFGEHMLELALENHFI